MYVIYVVYTTYFIRLIFFNILGIIFHFCEFFNNKILRNSNFFFNNIIFNKNLINMIKTYLLIIVYRNIFFFLNSMKYLDFNKNSGKIRLYFRDHITPNVVNFYCYTI